MPKLFIKPALKIKSVQEVKSDSLTKNLHSKFSRTHIISLNSGEFLNANQNAARCRDMCRMRVFLLPLWIPLSWVCATSVGSVVMFLCSEWIHQLKNVLIIFIFYYTTRKPCQLGCRSLGRKRKKGGRQVRKRGRNGNREEKKKKKGQTKCRLRSKRARIKKVKLEKSKGKRKHLKGGRKRNCT